MTKEQIEKLKIPRCPICHGDVRVFSSRHDEQGNIVSWTIQCPYCGARYSGACPYINTYDNVTDGIPTWKRYKYYKRVRRWADKLRKNAERVGE